MIEIVEYRKSWSQDFRDIARTIRHGLGGLALRIDHIGSTSVPGLCAKDVIDLQITVDALDARVTTALHALGYSWRRTSRATIGRPTTKVPKQTGKSSTFARRRGSAERTRTSARRAGRTNVIRCSFATT